MAGVAPPRHLSHVQQKKKLAVSWIKPRRKHQIIVYTWERNSEWLGSAWSFWTFLKNLWEGLRIIYGPFLPRLRFLADTINDWHFLSWTFSSHCSLEKAQRQLCFTFFPGLTCSVEVAEGASHAEAELRWDLHMRLGGPCLNFLDSAGFRPEFLKMHIDYRN